MERKPKQSAEILIKDIRRKTHRVFSSEQKIMIVMEVQWGEQSITDLWLKHVISSIFYSQIIINFHF